MAAEHVPQLDIPEQLNIAEQIAVAARTVGWDRHPAFVHRDPASWPFCYTGCGAQATRANRSTTTTPNRRKLTRRREPLEIEMEVTAR